MRKTKGYVLRDFHRLLLWLCIYPAVATADEYKYLGCYHDSTSDRDLDSREMFSVDLAACASECRTFGDPYTGLQAGARCYCGQHYGKHGTIMDCNFTCNGINCGGVQSNDVYYTPSVDVATESRRANVFYETVATFDAARRQCVTNNGDLVTVASTSARDSVLDVIHQANVTSGKTWIGLRRQPTDDVTEAFAWTLPLVATFIPSSFSSYWASNETQQEPCVVMDIAEGTWTTVSCTAEYVYVCHQIPLPASAATSDSGATSDSDTPDTSGYDSTKLSLYIVLPLFVFCYGGSCVFYCSHKLYRSLRRRKRQQVLLTKLEQREYEPDTKPVKFGDIRSGAPPPGAGGLLATKVGGRPGGISPRPFSPTRRGVVAPAPVAAPQRMAFGGDRHQQHQAPPPGVPFPTAGPPPRAMAPPQQGPRGPMPMASPPGNLYTNTPTNNSSNPGVPSPPRPKVPQGPPGPPGPPGARSPSSSDPDPRRGSGLRPGSRPMSVAEKKEVRRAALLNKALEEARERRKAEAAERKETTPPPDRPAGTEPKETTPPPDKSPGREPNKKASRRPKKSAESSEPKVDDDDDPNAEVEESLLKDGKTGKRSGGKRHGRRSEHP